MARAIDGDALKRWCEKIIDQACHPATVQIGEVFLDKVRSMPTLTPSNKPLTLEELREMDGEPVWCKWLLPEDRAIEQGKWFIVISGDEAGLEIKRPAEYGCHFCKIDDYGKTWLAYRRSPEGEEDA